MINLSARDRQDPLYFANLEDKGEYLREYSSRQLTVYLSYLKRYQKYLKSRSESIKFHWSNAEMPERYMQENKVYSIHLNIPDDLEQAEIDKYKLILDDINEANIRILYYFEPRGLQDKKRNKHRINILDIFEDDETLIVDSPPQSEILYPELSDLKISREINAFTKLLDRPDKHMIPLLMLSVPQRNAEWPDPENSEEPEWKILTDDTILGINAQREVVRKALSTPDFAVLEGPPGSGKTTVISELILQLLEQGKRVLVVASTHVAVDNVLERVVQYKDLVVPIRIAPRDRNLPEEIEKLTYAQYVRAFKEDLIKGLSEKKNRTKVENEWLVSIQGDDTDEVLQNLLDSTINVVCGTTIGVLQYPKIKRALHTGNFDPLFDVMIIDEASKTTFTEFIVPAMFAKKWVISGDPKQLSPFIERGLIEDQVKGILDDIHLSWYGNKSEGLTFREFEQICLSSFRALRILDDKKDDNIVSALLSIQGKSKNYAMAMQLQLQSLDPELSIHSTTNQFSNPVERCIAMNAADILIENDHTIREFQDCIPADAVPTAGARLPPFFNYRRNYVRKGRQTLRNLNDGERESPEEKQSLASEIAWRLIRAYELKSLPSRSREYKEQVTQLGPNWQSGNDDIAKKIRRVETISLPSVIEALILGINNNRGIESSVLVSGFKAKSKIYRWQRLTHQLRMHPDISYYARKFVYSDASGKAFSLMDEKVDREWSYQQYANRVAWIHVPGKEQRYGRHGGFWNPTEANAIVNEIKIFVGWTERNARDDGRQWEVALLTFYDKQTNEIKSRLASIYGGRGPYFRIKGSNVKLFVGNVDSMQGREADIVFLSMVRTSRVGFLDSPNRLNVAITRSRYQLVIMGDHGFFKKQTEELLVTKLANEIIPEYILRRKKEVIR